MRYLTLTSRQKFHPLQLEDQRSELLRIEQESTIYDAKGKKMSIQSTNLVRYNETVAQPRTMPLTRVVFALDLIKKDK